MAQVYMGSFSTTAREGRYLVFDWAVDSTNTEENYKDIQWSVYGAGVSGYVVCSNFTITIDGETVFSSSNSVNVWQGTVIASGKKRIYHNLDGTKVLTASVEAGIYEYAVNCYGIGSWQLQTIPRYANITKFAVHPRDETSVLYEYSTDAINYYAWYSTDNGTNWHEMPDTKIISGLTANTTYQFKLRLRRIDSQLANDSSAYPLTTYNYPHCIDSPDFTIGNPLTLKLYNPLNRNVIVKGYAKSNGAEIFGGEGVWSEITGFNDEKSINIQYASIPNAQSGQYKVVVSWNNKAMTRDAGNVYKIKGNEIPTLNSFDYIDGNNTVVAVTGDNTKILQNKSLLTARFLSATANYGAGGISSYVIECNGIAISGTQAGSYNLGVIDSSNDVKLKLTAYDSRGLSASKTITVKMIAYEVPKATVELKRLNNYEDETYLTVDGSVANVLDKNTMTIQYRYRLSSGSYGSFKTIGDRVKQTLSLDKNNEYIFNIIVTDVFGSKFNGEFVLNKGVFPLFIDTVKNSVGINCFPKNEKSLEVNGKDLYDFVNKYEKSHKSIYISNTGGLTITIENINGSDKIPIIITGGDNASALPVHSIIQYRTDDIIASLHLGFDEYVVTKDGNRIHLDVSQYSYFEVSVPMGCEIKLSNSAL